VAGERKIGTELANDMTKENEFDLSFYLRGSRLSGFALRAFGRSPAKAAHHAI